MKRLGQENFCPENPLENPKRRSALRTIVAVGALFATCSPGISRAGLFQSPVATNILRPPGAVSEDVFASRCIRCGRCAEVCPYKSIVPPDIASGGINAGTPLIHVMDMPCYLCMKCVEVCPTGTLSHIEQQETRMGLAVINRHTCAAWKDGLVMCRTCYNVCPFKEKAIKLDELRPVVIEEYCTGCGICTHGCPVSCKDGRKAINIEPLYSFRVRE